MVSEFTPLNPDYARVVAASFARQGPMRALGIGLAESRPGSCVLAAEHSPDRLQQHGYFHGAVIGAMLDCAGGHAARPRGADRRVQGELPECRRGERRVGRGKVVKPERRPTVASAEAFCVRGGVERLCAMMLQSLIRVAAQPAAMP